MENQVSIIINGVKYDEVEAECTYSCEICDLMDVCDVENNICTALNVHAFNCFKKSDKKFEP